ncbi:MAG: type II secretion system secretin GspD [Xanthomonadales bacterium]|nr:type II secretion system secretin GspD [Xanthomonadales bacterium]
MSRAVPVLVAAMVLISACGTVSPQRNPENRMGRIDSSAELKPGMLAGAESEDDTGGIDGVEVYPGSGEFINEQAARRPTKAVSEDGEIVLNFEAESLQSVVHTILGEVLQETFVIGPGVGGEVTFSTSKPVSRDQLMPILELLLRWNGATLVYSEGRYHVLPVSEAIRGHLVPQLGGASNVAGYEVRAVPLRYISATEMAKILEPYVRENAIVNVDLMRSMIFLAGTREELSNYMQTIEIFDVDWLSGMSVGVFPLKTVDVESITAELTEVFGTEADSPLAGLFRFVPLERLGSILVITPQEDYLATAREWIERLDRGAAGAGTQLYVYRVKNLEATVLAGYLAQLFGGSTSSPQQRNTSSRGMLAPGLQEARTGSVSDFNQSRLGNQQQSMGSTSSVLETEQGEIRITSVVETNSLLIQATQSQYDGILAAMRRIDEEPLQVLIEAQIIDVTLNDALQFGVNWFLTNRTELIAESGVQQFGEVLRDTSIGGTFLSNLTRVGGGGQSLIEATITALDSISDVRTLAAPSLLVRNNAQATITVGTQVPVQSSSISTGTNNVVSSAQYVSTGVTLNVTPRINPGGLVYLDITQDVSFPGERDEDISTSGNPPINTKSVTSQVAVQSGQTVFLGGLIQESSAISQSGLPGVSRVPGIGRLFGSKSRTNDRTETLVMITPTVITSNADLKLISDDLKKEFKNIPPIRFHTLQGDKPE